MWKRLDTSAHVAQNRLTSQIRIACMAAKSEETKKKIVKAARRLFRQQGYMKTSIDQICNESGVKRGNLYFHFKSKEELAGIVIDDAASRYIPFFETLMEDENDPLRKIELLIDGIVGYYAARGDRASCLFGNMAQEMGDSNRILGEAANRFFVAWADMIAGLFEEAKSAGTLRPDTDSDSLSHLVISAVEGALILYKASQEPEAFIKTGSALKSVIAGYMV